MSLSHSPQVVTNGLVFYYDMNNAKKSWKGRPTTNILPSPSTNGRFTTANSWGTYNTNQYNSGQYFSIGTIASVASDIVTTTAAHPLRTFDVIRAQSTGGGITAGTDYLIKKISSTQFSLHTYNGDQTGTQGYFVNGWHKVHESLGLDQRVSINATSFPTMWWGYPHLPNSHLVKEIVVGAGPQGQNTMRLHVPSVDGVVDGMAYGVYTPVTVGDVINISLWIRTNYSGKTLRYTTHFGASASSSTSWTVTTEWQRVSYQWTASATYSFISYWWPAGTTNIPYWIDIADFQVEINTGAAGSTPFTTGTRSNTQAIVDLTGNNTVTANSLTYASDGTFSFNGISDYISLPAFNLSTDPIVTVSQWIKRSANFSGGGYWGLGGGSVNDGISSYTSVQNKIGWDLWGQTTFHTGQEYPLEQWVNVCWVKIGTTFTTSTLKVYINGTEFPLTTIVRNNSSVVSLRSSLTMGRIADNTNSYYAPGSIGLTQVFSRALSTSEVTQNFNAIRGRYGI